ncbi:MAG: LysM peptidoglycan-binding domain-containing protein [Treponema sp.]|nr:LysM peptidoglycan-binding domain-containing protein [Treponema sp.]
MSKVHRVSAGDTLGSIAVRYLGSSSKWGKITAANPQLANRRRAADGSPIIHVGDTLIIPANETARSDSIHTETIVLANGEQDVSIKIDGKNFTGFTSYELTLSYDSFDTFSFQAPYSNAMKELQTAITPFTFKPCEIYYDGALILRGNLLTPDPELTGVSGEITLQGYPVCGILNDCAVPPTNYPLQVMGINMRGIAEAACEPYNIPVIFDGDIGPEFTEVSIEPTEKIMSFLTKLAKQRNLLFTNTPRGELLFFTPKDKKAFVFFTEGTLPMLSLTSKFTAQEFYSHITGFSKTAAEYPSFSYTLENRYLINKGIMRHHSIIVDDAENLSDLQNAVEAYGGRMFADCVSYELECDTHHNNDGGRFQKGMTVCIHAPTAMITRETNFTARKITFTRTTEGKKSKINLVLPGSFTGNLPEVFPWE